MSKISCLLSLSLLLSETAAANSASFPCARAATVVEKNICASPTLSRLDSELDTLYAKARNASANRDGLVKEQRDWIKTTRDACGSETCLAGAYETRIHELEQRLPSTTTSCPINENALLGSWRQTASADFEEFAFMRDRQGRNFTSWLHKKPEYAGTWTFDQCVIKISSSETPDLDFTFRVVGFSKRGLTLENTDDTTLSTYRKVR